MPATPLPDGCSADNGVNTVVKMPFVHRFDILERNGVHYLIACTLKSDHRYKDDWSSPGKVYAAVLPDDLTAFSGENQLHFEVICSELTKNHGYYHIPEEDKETAVISAQDGVFRFIPPSNSSGKWEIQKILDEPCSDGVLIDLDGDGVEELAVISPFHGDTIKGSAFIRTFLCLHLLFLLFRQRNFRKTGSVL